jgi:hypothetical protein
MPAGTLKLKAPEPLNRASHKSTHDVTLSAEPDTGDE